MRLSVVMRHARRMIQVLRELIGLGVCDIMAIRLNRSGRQQMLTAMVHMWQVDLDILRLQEEVLLLPLHHEGVLIAP